jgi:hypothetical protein
MVQQLMVGSFGPTCTWCSGRGCAARCAEVSPTFRKTATKLLGLRPASPFDAIKFSSFRKVGDVRDLPHIGRQSRETVAKNNPLTAQWKRNQSCVSQVFKYHAGIEATRPSLMSRRRVRRAAPGESPPAYRSATPPPSSSLQSPTLHQRRKPDSRSGSSYVPPCRP